MTKEEIKEKYDKLVNEIMNNDYKKRNEKLELESMFYYWLYLEMAIPRRWLYDYKM